MDKKIKMRIEVPIDGEIHFKFSYSTISNAHGVKVVSGYGCFDEPCKPWSSDSSMSVSGRVFHWLSSTFDPVSAFMAGHHGLAVAGHTFGDGKGGYQQRPALNH